MFRIIKKEYLLHSLLVLALMNLVFWTTKSEISEVGIELFLRKSAVCAIAVYVMQCLVKRPFFSRRWTAPLLFMGWWYLFAFVKCFVFSSGHSDLYENEIFIGTYGAAALIGLHCFCAAKESRAALFLVSLFEWLLCIPPVVTYVHQLIYGRPVVFEEMRAVYNTSFRETYEWFITYVGPVNMLVMAAVLALTMYIIQYAGRLAFKDTVEPMTAGRKCIILLAAMGALYYPADLLQRTDCTGYFAKAVEYSLEVKNYSKTIADRYENIKLTNPAEVGGTPHTVIMVIGESSGRDYMRAYNNDVPYDNTPWLSQCKNDSSFIVFNNAYACYSLTQQVLENALTERSYYNNKAFLESMNILDIAKKKGYKTYWITNLGGINTASSFALVASRADVVKAQAAPYDESMLDYMKEVVDPNTNNFIVLHGNGSHAAYKSRYPEDREVFKEHTVEAEYSNSLRYVDDFLKKVYEYGKDNLNLQVMLYYPDHGENLKTGHGPSDLSFDKVRIAMLMYFGEDYRKRNPERIKRLVSRRDTFFTNDMMYNTVSGILNAESNFYDGAEDISGENYRFTPEELWTFAHEVKVSDDPFLKNRP